MIIPVELLRSREALQCPLQILRFLGDVYAQIQARLVLVGAEAAALTFDLRSQMAAEEGVYNCSLLYAGRDFATSQFEAAKLRLGERLAKPV